MDERLECGTFCGLYCSLCAERGRIPERAEALRQAMEEEGWPYWGHAVPGFREFWAFLEDMVTQGAYPGCRGGGGYPECHIRACAQERGLDVCCHCPDFPCEHV